MKVSFSPQRSDDLLVYAFDGEIINVTLNGQSEIFDFSTMPDGELDQVETELPINPILNATRTNGELSVSLLLFHGANASQGDLFPKEKEVLADGTLKDIEESEINVQV